jgi:hypothetical protein
MFFGSPGVGRTDEGDFWGVARVEQLYFLTERKKMLEQYILIILSKILRFS